MGPQGRPTDYERGGQVIPDRKPDHQGVRSASTAKQRGEVVRGGNSRTCRTPERYAYHKF